MIGVPKLHSLLRPDVVTGTPTAGVLEPALPNSGVSEGLLAVSGVFRDRRLLCFWK